MASTQEEKLVALVRKATVRRGSPGERLLAERLKSGVCAVMLCYRDAEWAAFNVGRMYGRVDQFVVVVGPCEGFADEPDEESADRLRNVSDPDGKMEVLSGVWRDKNEMVLAAQVRSRHRAFFDLAPDELWPDEVVELACADLRDARGRPTHSVFRFLTFVGDSCALLLNGVGERHIEGVGALRALYVPPGSRFLHLLCGIEWYHDRLNTIRHDEAIWHFAWVGPRRVERKLRFYLNRFPERRHDGFMEMARGERETAVLSGGGRKRMAYDGPPLLPDVVEFVDRMAVEG
jgi:hypothetical protein